MEWKQIEILRVHEFEAVNQMSSSMGEYGGIVKKAEYQIMVWDTELIKKYGNMNRFSQKIQNIRFSIH